MNIYVYGLIGYETAARLYAKHSREVEARFPQFFLKQFEELRCKVEECVDKAAALKNHLLNKYNADANAWGELKFGASETAEINIKKAGAGDKSEIYIREIGKGGICRALWEAGETLKCGLEVDIRSIPVSQEVIEIMELFGAEPYESDSSGSFLIVSEQTLEDLDLGLDSCAYIGHTTRQKGRKLMMPDGVRFLTPPNRQQKDLQDREIHSQKNRI